jgi:hypothetical protein
MVLLNQRMGKKSRDFSGVQRKLTAKFWREMELRILHYSSPAALA